MKLRKAQKNLWSGGGDQAIHGGTEIFLDGGDRS